MRILILGGGGMLGHKLVQIFVKKFEVFAAFRSDKNHFGRIFLPPAKIAVPVNLVEFDELHTLVEKVAPTVIINAAGVVKQNLHLADADYIWRVNAELPQKLAEIAVRRQVRLICLGTDCVFSGKRGNYAETDQPDAADLYGKSKIAGEIGADGCLTLRTSIIGRELESSHGLVEWLFQNRGKTVKGFRKAFFSGFPTIVLAEILSDVIINHRELSGVYHLAAARISKFELLELIKKYFNLNIEIEPDDDFEIDRSLNGGKFEAAANFKPQSWEEMIKIMAKDEFPYAEFRNENFRK